MVAVRLFRPAGVAVHHSLLDTSAARPEGWCLRERKGALVASGCRYKAVTTVATGVAPGRSGRVPEPSVGYPRCRTVPASNAYNAGTRQPTTVGSAVWSRATISS